MGPLNQKCAKHKQAMISKSYALTAVARFVYISLNKPIFTRRGKNMKFINFFITALILITFISCSGQKRMENSGNSIGTGGDCVGSRCAASGDGTEEVDPGGAFYDNSHSTLLGYIEDYVYPATYKIEVYTQSSVYVTEYESTTDDNGDFEVDLLGLSITPGFYKVILYAKFDGDDEFTEVDDDYMCDVDSPDYNPSGMCDIIPVGEFTNIININPVTLHGVCVAGGYSMEVFYPRGHVDSIRVNYQAQKGGCAELEDENFVNTQTADYVLGEFDKWGDLSFLKDESQRTIFTTSFSYEGEMNYISLSNVWGYNNIIVKSIEVDYNN